MSALDSSTLAKILASSTESKTTESKTKRKPYTRPDKQCFDFKVLGDEEYGDQAQKCYDQWADLDADCNKKWHKECAKSYDDIGAAYWRCRQDKTCPEPPTKMKRTLATSKILFNFKAKC